MPAAVAGSVTVTIDDVMPNWGEGNTMAEARDDLLRSTIDLFRDLRSASVRLQLGTALQAQYEFMEALRQGLNSVTDEAP